MRKRGTPELPMVGSQMQLRRISSICLDDRCALVSTFAYLGNVMHDFDAFDSVWDLIGRPMEFVVLVC